MARPGLIHGVLTNEQNHCMKRTIPLLIAALLLASCDDGAETETDTSTSTTTTTTTDQEDTADTTQSTSTTTTEEKE